MLEIEIKVPISDQEEMRTHLASQGIVFDALEYQKDTIFVQNGSTITDFYQNHIFCRIRKKATGNPILTVKKKQQDLASLEYESEISSEESVASMLEIFGFTFHIEVEKSRYEGKYKDYSVCIDKVTAIGSFLEIEKMVPEDTDIEDVKKELREALNSLGVSITQETPDAYDTMVLKTRLL